MDHISYMRRAIALAKKGEGYVSPNPMVGCVIVKDGQIIAEGFHERFGGFHAERNALLTASADPKGADLYVTLEPCCHYGKTPPCTEIILEKRIGRVFVGSMDPNPLVAGKGVRILEEAGVQVETGICKEECDTLNEVFFSYIQTKKPFVAMKYAMSLDGKIACASGDSRWVTGEESRQVVHQMRKRYSGIMAGIGTVLADDPMLNCRVAQDADPVRIICDSNLRIPADCQIVQTADKIETIIACTQEALASEEGSAKKNLLEEAGITILPVNPSATVDLAMLMTELGKRGIDSILLEGGGTLNAAALNAKIVNKVYAFVAPKMIGGKDAKSPVEGIGAEVMAQAVLLERMKVESFGTDICISGYPVYP